MIENLTVRKNWDVGTKCYRFDITAEIYQSRALPGVMGPKVEDYLQFMEVVKTHGGKPYTVITTEVVKYGFLWCSEKVVLSTTTFDTP